MTTDYQEGQISDFFCGRNHHANFTTQAVLNQHLLEVHGVPTTVGQRVLAKIDEDMKSLEEYATHLKLMIDAGSHKAEPDWALVQYLDIAENSLKHLRALRSVTEGHCPNEDNWCEECHDEKGKWINFPCNFIKGIASVLGVELGIEP